MPVRGWVVFCRPARKPWMVRYPVSDRRIPYLQVEPSLHGTYVVSRFRPVQNCSCRTLLFGRSASAITLARQKPPSAQHPRTRVRHLESSQRSPRSVGCSGISFFRQSFRKVHLVGSPSHGRWFPLTANPSSPRWRFPLMANHTRVKGTQASHRRQCGPIP